MAESALLDLGSGPRAVGDSGSDRIGLINLVAKCAGARSEGNLHAACEVAGAGNGATDTVKRARRGNPGYSQASVLMGHRASSRPYGLLNTTSRQSREVDHCTIASTVVVAAKWWLSAL